MSDGDNAAGVGGEVLFEPQHRLGVEVVGRLIEEQQVRLLQQQLAQGDPALLTTREHGDLGVRRRAAQRVHRLLELGVEIPGVRGVDLLLQLTHLGHQRIEVGVRVGHQFGNLVVAIERPLDVTGPLLDIAQDGLGLVQLGLLHEDADAVARGQPRLPVGRLLQAGHDLQDRGLAGAIGADDADLGAGEEGEGDIIEDDLLPMRLARAREDVNELRHRVKANRADACARIVAEEPVCPFW